MRNWLIGAAILVAAPAHAGEMISNGDFSSSQTSATIVGSGASGTSAAASWDLWNNTNASTFSEIVANFGGRANLLHIVTGGSFNGAYQMLTGNALNAYADIYVVRGQALFGALSNGGTQPVGAALTSGTEGFQRLTLTTSDANPFNEVVLYSFGDGAEFYVDLASAESDAVAPVPEPATWAMIIVGFGAIGAALRRRKMVAGMTYA